MASPNNTRTLALTPTDPTKTGFADLPGELRNAIYHAIAASIPVQITFNDGRTHRIPLTGIHPLIDRELGSMFFSTPRIFRFCYANPRHSHGIPAAAKFLKSWACRLMLRTKCPRILVSLELPWPADVGYNSLMAKRAQSHIKWGVEQYINEEHARLRDGGEERACPIARWRRRKPMFEKVSKRLSTVFWSCGGEALCEALWAALPEWAEEQTLHLAVGFKSFEREELVFTVQQTSVLRPGCGWTTPSWTQ
ncbi:uncharacterized protein BDZ99DRAFT_514614 [Mytilinidion resinicola]|uniref:Uncharacterized protein n=1 Tax=Mytilinidion resinicola TaxID=574789 RepID=A0A6A6Z6X4_9PEZI|nr:uncharacterized protein BDZ99DRAFT_514614 [Mytilinidion resinicola]KAF2815995.1 hypothetical protein BDZ99DRAFT_514614 [Mytilinidion resinicola]